MRRIMFLLVATLFVGLQAFAQTSISGTVTDSKGEAVPGANVRAKGYADVGTVTDFNGKYTLSVPSEATTLVFSFVGMESKEVEIGGQSIVNASLENEDVGIDEVVVTALGISKEKKALGYAVSDISSDELEAKPESDMVRLLNGKAAGVKVTSTGGVSGTGTNITIRGYSSLTGGNQPLFIVDGVRFSGSTNSGTSGSQGFLDGNQATSSRSLDLDPANIENISILKGLSATTIYGNEGRNGVIMITTKNGSGSASRKGLEVTVNQSYFMSEVNLPDYQENYANGFQQNFGFFFSNWGPKIDNANPMVVPHPITNMSPSIQAELPEYVGADYEVKFYDNQKNFFRKGTISNTSVSFRGGNEKSNYSASVSFNKDQGFVPGNQLEKFNVSLGGGTQLNNKIKLNGTMNFVKTDMETPPISYGSGSGLGNGSGISIFADILYTPISVDLMGLPFETPVTHRSVYYRSGNDIQNPRWTAKYAKSTDNVVRVYGTGSLSYEIVENLTLGYKYGLDYYAETQEYHLNAGSVQNDSYVNGMFRSRNLSSTTWDNTVTLSYVKKITEDLSIDVLAGGNSIRELYRADGMESTNQLVFGFMNHKNFIDHSTINSFTGSALQSVSEVNTLGVFAQASMDYKNYLYLNLAGRNDFFSSLEKDYRSLFYPSISLSFIPTQLFEQITSPNGLNYTKLRIGYGTSAGFPPLYVTRDVLAASSRAFVNRDGSVVASNSVSNRLGNPDLKPEKHKEFEVGLEAKALNNRIGLDFTYYKKTTEDLITDSDLDPTTGYTGTYVNIGEIENSGIEVEFSATPVKVNDLQWDLSLIFTKYESLVKKLAEGQEKILISGFTNLGNFAKEGEPYGVMMGSLIKRNDNGDALIDGTGSYLESDEIGIMGNPHPDFETSISTTLSYKGLSFYMQWDYRKGGDIYSGTARALLARGITKDTDFDRTQTFILPGISEDTGLPNEIQTTATNFYFNNIGFGPSEVGVYDGTTIRLREVSLAYTLPKKWLSKSPFGSASVSIIGQNLWYKAVNFPEHINFDTDMLSLGVGNGLGFDFITGPSSKRYGFSVKLTF